MKDESRSGEPAYPLTTLCLLADLPPRTVRYYVQIGLVDRPEGGTRAARYGARHLEQLLSIKKWSAAGVSLERIRELLHGAPPPVPLRPPAVGSVSVRSHILVAPGVELVVEPEAAGLTPAQLRELAKGVTKLYDRLHEPDGRDEERLNSQGKGDADD